MVDFESKNLGDGSYGIYFPNQSKVLGNHHSDDDNSIDVHGGEYPSVPVDILVSQEYVFLKI